MNNRKFIISIKINNIIKYIKSIYGNRLGYYYSLTNFKEKAKVWKSQKTCENAIIKILKYGDPIIKRNLMSIGINDIKFEALEITDIKELRNIKLKKLSK